VTSTTPAPNPEEGPSDYERVEGLRAYLLETLPPESYAYLDRGAHSGALTIGYLDKAAIQKTIADYTGTPCPVYYEEAHCSEAQNRAFWKATEAWTLPVGARLERVGPPAVQEGLFLAIHATSEKQAQSVEKKLQALAKKQEYPTESLTITYLLPGENPNT